MKAALLAAVLGLVLCAGTVAAQDIVWNGANGVWNLASNWTPANVPNAPGEVAVLPVVAAPYTVDLNISIGLDAVRLEDPASTFRLGGQTITFLQAAGFDQRGDRFGPTAALAPLGRHLQSHRGPDRRRTEPTAQSGGPIGGERRDDLGESHRSI